MQPWPLKRPQPSRECFRYSPEPTNAVIKKKPFPLLQISGAERAGTKGIHHPRLGGASESQCMRIPRANNIRIIECLQFRRGGTANDNHCVNRSSCCYNERRRGIVHPKRDGIDLSAWAPDSTAYQSPITCYITEVLDMYHSLG